MCINVKPATQTLHFWLNAHIKKETKSRMFGKGEKHKASYSKDLLGGGGGGGGGGVRGAGRSVHWNTHRSNRKHKAKGSISKSALFQTVQKLQQRLLGAEISLVLLVPQHYLQLPLLPKCHNSVSLSTRLSPERPCWSWFHGRLSSPSCCCVRMERGTCWSWFHGRLSSPSCCCVRMERGTCWSWFHGRLSSPSCCCVRMERGTCWSWFHGRLSSPSCCCVRMERGTSWQGGGWCGRCHDAESTATFALHQFVCWGIVHQPVSIFRLKCRNKTLTCKHN